MWQPISFEQVRRLAPLARPHVVSDRMVGIRDRNLFRSHRRHHVDGPFRYLIRPHSRRLFHLARRLGRPQFVDRQVGVEAGRGLVEAASGQGGRRGQGGEGGRCERGRGDDPEGESDDREDLGRASIGWTFLSMCVKSRFGTTYCIKCFLRHPTGANPLYNCIIKSHAISHID